MINSTKLALVVGGFFAFFHAVWALAVAVVPGGMQWFLDWIFTLHFLQPVYVLTPANWFNAILLVLVTFIVGYVMGYVLGSLRNMAHKK